MKNLHICGLEDDQILWRLNIGGICDTDGYCNVRDGRVETPQLREDMHVDLRPVTVRVIRKACQEWLNEKPERDRKDQEWNANYEYYKGLWETWEDHENVEGRLYQAIPSVYHEPDEIAVQGECRFIAYDENGDLWRSTLYNNPTWGDVLRAFDESMEHTDDYHHVFLEGIYKSEFENEYYFSTGS